MNPNGLEYGDGIVGIKTIIIYLITLYTYAAGCYGQYSGTKENFRLRSTKII